MAMLFHLPARPGQSKRGIAVAACSCLGWRVGPMGRCAYRWVRIAAAGLLVCNGLADAQAKPAARPPAWVLSRQLRQMIAGAKGATGSVVLAPTALNFQAGTPGAEPTVAASSAIRAYVYIAQPQGSVSWTLAVQSQGQRIEAGNHSIPVASVGWTSTGAVILGNGTVTANASASTLAATATATAHGLQGTANPFVALVTCSFFFFDSWNYTGDSYSQTVMFTLTAP